MWVFDNLLLDFVHFSHLTFYVYNGTGVCLLSGHLSLYILAKYSACATFEDASVCMYHAFQECWFSRKPGNPQLDKFQVNYEAINQKDLGVRWQRDECGTSATDSGLSEARKLSPSCQANAPHKPTNHPLPPLPRSARVTPPPPYLLIRPFSCPHPTTGTLRAKLSSVRVSLTSCF